jgi:hypothetical protein
MHIALHYPGGKAELGDLVVVYDPATGHYFWRYTNLQGPNDNASFLSAMESGAEAIFTYADGIVDFYAPWQLFAELHTNRAGSLDAAAAQAISEIRQDLATFEKRGFHSDVKGVFGSGSQAIEPGFHCQEPPISAICDGPRTQISAITHDDGLWRLVLKARWDEEVILDHTFQFVRARRLPQPSSGK